MHIDLIKMPLNLGANHDGVELGSNILDNFIRDSKCFASHSIHFYDEIQCPSYHDINDQCSLMKNKREIFKVDTNLADSVYKSLERGHFPLILGGDHALSWGTISGVIRHRPNVGCVYVDAHGDFNLAEMSPSHNVHGMHMAYLMGLSDSEYNNFYRSGIKLNKDNVFFIGTRSLDWGEKELAQKNNLHIQTSAEIKTRGVEDVVSELLEQMEKTGLQHFHLSYDIDAIDPEIAPGTGVPEKNGINLYEAKYILAELLKTGKFISMDLVEFNPLLDKDDKTLNVCMELLSVVDLCL